MGAPREPIRFVHPELGPMPGYVVGLCHHRVAESEWRAGFVVCERCAVDDFQADSSSELAAEDEARSS